MATTQRGKGRRRWGRRVAIIGWICTSRGTEIEFQKRHVTLAGPSYKQTPQWICAHESPCEIFDLIAFLRLVSIYPTGKSRAECTRYREGRYVGWATKTVQPALSRCTLTTARFARRAVNLKLNDSRGKFDNEANGLLGLLSNSSEWWRISHSYVLMW